MVPVGSTKKPVPESSLCSSTAWILTTALPQRSKMALTSRLMAPAVSSWAGRTRQTNESESD